MKLVAVESATFIRQVCFFDGIVECIVMESSISYYGPVMVQFIVEVL